MIGIYYKSIYSFIKKNIEQINIGTLSSYNISSYDVNALINYISMPNYISFKIVSTKEEQSNTLNGNEYKDEDELILQILFDQYLILKTIILEVFLNECAENDEYIKNDMINQVKVYYSNNILNTNDNKTQLLISAINENMKENIKFKDKFISVFNQTVITNNY